MGRLPPVEGCDGSVLLGIALCTVAVDVVFVSEGCVAVASLLSLGGEIDRCGVMISGTGRVETGAEALPSFVCVAAGVNGGECTADVMGDRPGEASLEPPAEPAGSVLRGGAPVADVT